MKFMRACSIRTTKLSRLIYGGRLSWLMGIAPVLIALGIGGVLGVAAGYAGGWVNMAVMRTTDVFYAFSSVRVHVLLNVLGPIFVYAASLVSVSMILAAGLSFLGLGTKPPEAEWGLMLNTLRTAICSQPVLATLPGLCIFATSICFNMASDGLRAAMDVRS